MSDILVERDRVAEPVTVSSRAGPGNPVSDQVLLELEFFDAVGVPRLLVSYKCSRLVEPKFVEGFFDALGFNLILGGVGRVGVTERYRTERYRTEQLSEGRDDSFSRPSWLRLML